jgi:hypothetical protein
MGSDGFVHFVEISTRLKIIIIRPLRQMDTGQIMMKDLNLVVELSILSQIMNT